MTRSVVGKKGFARLMFLSSLKKTKNKNKFHLWTNCKNNFLVKKKPTNFTLTHEMFSTCFHGWIEENEGTSKDYPAKTLISDRKS